MKKETQIRVKQLQIIAVAWMIMGVLISVHDYLVLQTDTTLGPSGQYSFLISLARNVGAGLVGALLGGSFLVFYVNVKYHDKPYFYTILVVSIGFIIVVAIITVIMGIVLIGIQKGNPFSDPSANAAFRSFLRDKSHIKAAVVWSFIVGVTQLLLQVSSKFGHGTFWNMLRGRYNTPREEKKIFMFLDINSSTTIAEQLGDEKYHALLKDFFADITYPILDNKGSIYQYVGDEVVIAWDYKDGKENMQCIRSFYDMRSYIGQNREKYLQRYGLVPSFKAGIHCGKVIGGEVGIMKRDITYSGDVLNTTSRILNKCSELNQDLIVSDELLSEINSVKDYIRRPLGAIKLKGKAKEVFLNALAPVYHSPAVA
jgi:adenylate cyclase